VRRREFVLASVATMLPLAASAQQPTPPVIAMLNGQSADSYAPLVAAVRLGLQDEGFADGQNVTMEYHWADGRYERLPAMAVELAQRRVAAILSGGSIWATISAKAATSTIPIVFTTGSDPVKDGYVSNLNRPGGNVTGVSFLGQQLLVKRLELAAQLGSKESLIGFLGRPTEPRYAADRREFETAAAALQRKVMFFEIGDASDLDAAFAAAARAQVGALVVHGDPFFNSHREELIAAAARHAVPTVYELRHFVTAGGLISYGASLVGAYRQAGAYLGRILKGAKPNDLPVIQSMRFEFTINLKAAKALGLVIPQSLLVAADEVIE
jgi:ABC-type uncharacterized transport system substrate-binding protein